MLLLCYLYCMGVTFYIATFNVGYAILAAIGFTFLFVMAADDGDRGSDVPLEPDDES